jgi:ABC-type multidrug transport system ATPase subunit
MTTPPHPPPLLELREVDFHYPGRPAEPVLRLASLAVRPGDRVGILGDNGTGKSTIPRLLLGQFAPQRGEVRLFGAPARAAHHYPALAFVGDLSFLTGGASLPADVPADKLLAACRALHPPGPAARRDYDLWEMLGLNERRFSKPIGELSKGMRMRVQFGLALAKRPRLLVADEATEGLDHDSRKLLLGAVRRLATQDQTAVVWITHRVDEVASLAARAYELRDGRLREWGGELFDVSWSAGGERPTASTLPALAVLNLLAGAMSSSAEPPLRLEVRRKENVPCS